jgi:hypothetical protein
MNMQFTNTQLQLICQQIYTLNIAPLAFGAGCSSQASPHEPWGIYCARDMYWMPGSLEKLAGHM